MADDTTVPPYDEWDDDDTDIENDGDIPVPFEEWDNQTSDISMEQGGSA